LVLCEWNFGEPAIQVFFAELVDVGMTVNFDETPRLGYVDTVEHVEETLPFKWDWDLFIDQVEQDVWHLLVRGSNGKVINLLHEYNALASNDARVVAGFVNSRCQA
jgi:hypothetical protein